MPPLLSRTTLPTMMALVLGMAFLFLIRLPLAWHYLGFTSDMGSYLMTRNWVTGNDPTGYNPLHFRPPLIGVLLLVPTWLLGDLMASKLLAILASVLVAVPGYVLARRSMSPWLSILVGMLLALQVTYGDWAAGGYISLLSLIPYGVCLRLLIDTAEDGARAKTLFLLFLSTLVLAGLNQTIVPIWGLTALIVWIFAQQKRATFLALLVSGLGIAVWVWPFYTVHTESTGLGGLTFPGLPLVEPEVNIGLVVAIYAAAVLYVMRRQKARYLAPLIIVMAFIGSFSSSNAVLNNGLHRAGFVVPLLAAVLFTEALASAAVWLGAKLAARRRTPTVEVASPQTSGWHLYGAPLLVVLALMLAFGGEAAWEGSFNHLAGRTPTLTEDNLAAINWIRAETPVTSKVYVHPNGLGWWLGGLAPRNWAGSWYVPPYEYTGQDAAFRCAVGTPIATDPFPGRRSDCDPYALRDTYGISYLLVQEDTFQGIYGVSPYDLAHLGERPWLVPLVRYGRTAVYGWRG